MIWMAIAIGLVLVGWAIDLFVDSPLIPAVTSLALAASTLLFLGVSGWGWLWMGLPGMCCIFMIQYWIWKSWLLPWVSGVVAPTKFEAGVTRFIGVRGEVVYIDGQFRVRVHGETLDAEGDLPSGTRVVVEGVRSGKLQVVRVQE